jgi:NADH-quinone oxidoreductase subunit L
VNVLGNWLAPVFADLSEAHLGSESLELTLFLVSSTVALLGLFIAYARYIPEWGWAKSLQKLFSPLQNTLEHKYWVDEFYMNYIVNPLRRLSEWFYRVFDGRFIEGIVNGVGAYTIKAGSYVARMQTGVLGMYALSFFVGVVLILIYFLLFV